MPAYNCAATVRESVQSIIQGNLEPEDEIVIVDDASTDGTKAALAELEKQYGFVNVIHHKRNRGGGAARNTAVEHSRHDLIFCLDSDNLLAPGMVSLLKQHLRNVGADAASFQEFRFFTKNRHQPSHKWVLTPGIVSLANYLATPMVPGSSGNYLYTKTSWEKAGGYPEQVGALDTWGFGFRQAAVGTVLEVVKGTHYDHRYGHESYWVREEQAGRTWISSLQILLPYLDRLEPEDVDYVFSNAGRKTWFTNLEKRPLRVVVQDVTSTGYHGMVKDSKPFHGSWLLSVKDLFWKAGKTIKHIGMKTIKGIRCFSSQ